MTNIITFLKDLLLQLRSRIINYMDYKQLKKSFNEVTWLTTIAFLPLIINVIIKTIEVNSLYEAFKVKVLPIELLTFCMSFLAPSMYLLIKMDGKNYRLPFLHFFSLSTFLLYIICLVLNIITKNNFVLKINESLNSESIYLKISVIALLITIVFRIYAIYHGKKSSDYQEIRDNDQQNFNETFRNAVNE